MQSIEVQDFYDIRVLYCNIALCGNMAANCNIVEWIGILSLIILYWILLGNSSPFVLCERETWSFSLREEHALWVSERRVLRKIFGPKKEEVTGVWRELSNGELNDMESPPVLGVITLDEGEMNGVFVMHEKQEKCIQNFVGGILRNMTAQRWEDNKVIIIHHQHYH